MKPAAAKVSTTKEEKKRAAKRLFLVSLLDLTTRLLGAMLGPLFLGLYIDSRRAGNGQGFALAGFALGMIAGVFAIRSIIKKVANNGADIE